MNTENFLLDSKNKVRIDLGIKSIKTAENENEFETFYRELRSLCSKYDFRINQCSVSSDESSLSKLEGLL